MLFNIRDRAKVNPLKPPPNTIQKPAGSMLLGKGIELGRILGIPVTIHPSWLVILILGTMSMGGLYSSENSINLESSIAYPLGALTIIIVFGCVIAHEFGHVLAARFFGIGTERVTLFILGGVAHMKQDSKTPVQEFVIAIMGPVVSALCAAIFFGISAMGRFFGWSEAINQVTMDIALFNTIFVIFNMLPGFPMDGGRVLRASLWGLTNNHLLSTRIAAFIGQSFGFLIIFLGIMVIVGLRAPEGFIHVLLGVFLFFIAKRSGRFAEIQAALSKYRVRDFMRPIGAVVPIGTPIGYVNREFFSQITTDILPVVDDFNVLGFIKRDVAQKTEQNQWEMVRVEEVMEPVNESGKLDPDQDAMSAIETVDQLQCFSVPVFRENTLVGFVFQHDLIKLYRKSMMKPV